MKTLSHYQKLREDYACIIPKTAPAYELIEALDVLIGSLQSEREQPLFLGVPVNLPLGWAIVIDHERNVIILTDHGGVRRAIVYETLKGEYAIWWDGKHKTTSKTQPDAVRWLNEKVNSNAR